MASDYVMVTDNETDLYNSITNQMSGGAFDEIDIENAVDAMVERVMTNSKTQVIFNNFEGDKLILEYDDEFDLFSIHAPYVKTGSDS